LLGFTATPLLSQGKTIVIGRVGACGAVNVVEAPCWISDNAMYVSQWHTDCDIEYIALALRSIDLSRLAKKGAQPSISQEAVYSALIPLPPLEEQRRIVARIEELMGRVREARRLRQEAQKDAEHLWQSVLAQTFPRPGSELPKSWRWVGLGEVSRIYAGSPAPQGGQYFREGKWPFVRVQDLGRYGQTTCLKETADYVNEYALQKYHLRLAKAWTILFPKSGAAILTNSRAVLGVDAYIVSHLAAVEPLPDRLDTYWTYFWLCTVDMKQLIDNPSYPSLRLSEISKLLIPLPPLAEQRRIVAELEAVRGRVKAVKLAQGETDSELQRLQRAILDKAFRGEL
jgi:type I restriction enzyme S subunit